ncbi:unnamed protein product [Arabis nemorensis]|uniref:FKB95-like N-terminal Kelch domain-containing protein n=1 Tax=Arabis nemorensis TaxID=586526 RepID=A0A565BN54_9BRAS|nr:unnamed protein product [Arabis nemorensis]
MFSSLTVTVDSEIYFIGTELWILDTRSGKLRQGPIMQKSLSASSRSTVGVVDGKIYVIDEVENGEIHEEVFDLESQTWKVDGVHVPDEKVNSRWMMKSCVTLEGKVYAMEYHDSF